MACQQLKPARNIATLALNQFDAACRAGQVDTYASNILNRLLEQTDEKQRATDLVFGTVRNRAAIDMAITRFGDCPVERIHARLLNIVRIGTYELIYSPATPEYSIVNEAVENARTVGGKKQTGFVNALLRQINRHIKNRQISLSEAAVTKTVPQSRLTGCEFDIDILSDPKVSPADYLGAAFSLPKWLVNDWLAEFGPAKTEQICFASNRKPSTYIRPNRLKTTTKELAKKFRKADVDPEILLDQSMIRIKAARAVTELPGFSQGLFTVQDITASKAAEILKPQPGWTILDLCAAPGAKTTQLAELTDDSAKIIATDISSERLQMVRENIARLDIRSVSVVEYENIEKVAAKNGPFDAVLLDVPCSNTGVLAKRVEVRYRINPKAVKQLTKTQGDLLTAAAKMLKPNGKICYSTCSIQKQENNELVGEFLKKNHNFKLEFELLTLPSAEGIDCDGGYVAVITGK